MTKNEIINAFTHLGNYILSDHEDLKDAINNAFLHNTWFDRKMVSQGLKSMAHKYFNQKEMERWTANSTFAVTPKNVAIIMAGNISCVGMHDLMAVLISGHKASVKLSSKDQILPAFIIEKLISYEPKLAQRIEIIPGPMKKIEAVIATGSDNSAMYFHSYFGKYPHIIRKNRNAVAVLTGNETEEDLLALGEDIFMHFGLGCRNVSKLFLPKGYNLHHLLDVLHHYGYMMDNNKYKNNFDYNLTLLLMNSIDHLKNDSLLLVEDENIHSRIATLHYQYYHDLSEVTDWIAEHKENIQCVVGRGYLPFGEAQNPGLTNYADGVNTLQFLAELSK